MALSIDPEVLDHLFHKAADAGCVSELQQILGLTGKTQKRSQTEVKKDDQTSQTTQSNGHTTQTTIYQFGATGDPVTDRRNELLKPNPASKHRYYQAEKIGVELFEAAGRQKPIVVRQVSPSTAVIKMVVERRIKPKKAKGQANGQTKSNGSSNNTHAATHANGHTRRVEIAVPDFNKATRIRTVAIERGPNNTVWYGASVFCRHHAEEEDQDGIANGSINSQNNGQTSRVRVEEYQGATTLSAFNALVSRLTGSGPSNVGPYSANSIPSESHEGESKSSSWQPFNKRAHYQTALARLFVTPVVLQLDRSDYTNDELEAIVWHNLFKYRAKNPSNRNELRKAIPRANQRMHRGQVPEFSLKPSNNGQASGQPVQSSGQASSIRYFVGAKRNSKTEVFSGVPKVVYDADIPSSVIENRNNTFAKKNNATANGSPSDSSNESFIHSKKTVEA